MCQSEAWALGSNFEINLLQTRVLYNITYSGDHPPMGLPNSKVAVGDFSELQNTTVERCSAVDFITGQLSHCRT